MSDIISNKAVRPWCLRHPFLLGCVAGALSIGQSSAYGHDHVSDATTSPSVDRVQAGKLNHRYQKYWLTQPNQYISHRITPRTLASRQVVVSVEIKVLGLADTDAPQGKLVVGFGSDEALRVTEVGAVIISPDKADDDWRTIKLPVTLSSNLSTEGWYMGVRNDSFKGAVVVRHLDVAPLKPSAVSALTSQSSPNAAKAATPVTLKPVRTDLSVPRMAEWDLGSDENSAKLSSSSIWLQGPDAKVRFALPSGWKSSGPVQLDLSMQLSGLRDSNHSLPEIRLHRGDHWDLGRVLSRRVATKAGALTDTMVSIIVDAHHWPAKTSSDALHLIVDHKDTDGKTTIKSVKASVVYDADVTYGLWTGRGENNRWDNPENWSGRRLPRTTDDVVLSDRSGKPCNIEGQLITVGSLTVESGYTGKVVGAGRIVLTKGDLVVGRGQGNALAHTTIEFTGAAQQRIQCEADTTVSSMWINKTAHRLSVSGRKLAANTIRLANGSALALYNESITASQLQPYSLSESGVVASIEGIANRIEQPMAIALVHPGLALRAENVDEQLAMKINQRSVPTIVAMPSGEKQKPLASVNVVEMSDTASAALSGLADLPVMQERTTVEEAFLTPVASTETSVVDTPQVNDDDVDITPQMGSQASNGFEVVTDEAPELSRREARRLGQSYSANDAGASTDVVNATAKRTIWTKLGQWMGLSKRANSAKPQAITLYNQKSLTAAAAPASTETAPTYNFVTSANQNEIVSHHTELDSQAESRRARRKGGI